MRQIFFVLVLSISILFISTSCSGIFEQKIDQSELEIFDGHRLSTFYTNILWKVDNQNDFKIKLKQLDGSNSYELAAKCEFSKKTMKVTLVIPDGVLIKNGEYVISSSAFGREVLKRYKVRFENEMVTFIDDLNQDNYSKRFNGAGTEFSPYMIVTSSDLDYLFFCLSTDDTFASSIYFRQLADIECSSGGMEKRALGSESFAGHYDGGGFSLTSLSYIGAGKENDSDRGLFNTLYNGAEIKNLYIDNIYITKVNDRAGAIAGSANGKVTLENVVVSGNIDGHNNLGGLLGECKADAEVIVKDCKLNVSIKSTGECVGGIIGSAYRSKVTISNTNTISNNNSTPYSEKFLLEGQSRVGGAIGMGNDSNILIEGVKLYHSSNINNSDIAIVSGNYSVGGVVGELVAGSKSEIKNCDIILLIDAKERLAGGYIGHVDVGQNFSVLVENCKLTGLVKAPTKVGGISGDLSLKNSAQFSVNNYYFGSSSLMESPYKVEGETSVGGLIGEVTGNDKNTSVLSLSDISLVANVTSPYDTESYGYVGGIAGKVKSATVKLSKCTIGGGTTEIKGPFKVGGLIGELESSVLDGDNDFNIYSNSPIIPASSSFYYNFNGHVKPYNANASTRYMGGAVGNVVLSSINGLHIKGYVAGKGNYTGGVFGFIRYDNDLLIEDCSFNGDVSGVNYTGGIVGEIEKRGKLRECINYGVVEGNDNVGGIVGKIQAASDEPYVSYCVNIGSVSGVSEIGGIAGLMAGGDSDWCKIHNCANYGTISGSTTSDFKGVGGILGESTMIYSNVQYCVNFGLVKGTGNGGKVCVGGIAGKIGDASPGYELNVSLRECANYGGIETASSNGYVGGIAGYLEEGRYLYKDNSIIENCYNSAAIDHNKSHDAGGIVGGVDNNCMISRCINYGNIPYGNGIIGTNNPDEGNEWDYTEVYTLAGTYKSGDIWPKHTIVFTSDQMGNSEYWKDSDLNFDNIWIIKNGRPELRSCPFQYSKLP